MNDPSRHELYKPLGPNRIFEEPADNTMGDPDRDFSPSAYKKMKPVDRMDLISIREFILSILEVDNLADIPKLFKDEDRKKRALEKLVNNYCEMLGIEGDLEFRTEVVRGAMEDADSVLRMMDDPQIGLLRQLRGTIASINEVSIIKNPIDLMLLMFSPKASRRIRYEARRKLLLTELALRDRATKENSEDKLDPFVRFLNSHVLEGGLGSLAQLDIVSYHNPTDYSCTGVEILEDDDVAKVSEFTQFHRFKTREWRNKRGKKRHVIIEHRNKGKVNRILKLMRKDVRDPRIIDDSFGLKLTFETKADILAFIRLIQRRADEQGSSIIVEDTYDTIRNDDQFRITNPGSSPRLEIIKAHIIYQGTRIELQLHTYTSLIDSRLRDDIGFEEFSIKRLFERGNFVTSVIELLYPPDIYGNLVTEYYHELLADIRENKRVRSHFLPLERSEGGRKRVRYSDHDLVTDSANILDSIEIIPDVIIAVKLSGLPLGRELAARFSGARLHVINSINPDEIGALRQQIAGNENVLIVDDVGGTCEHILAVKQAFPNAKTAVLGLRRDLAPENLIDYHGRELQSNEWLDFSWDRGLEQFKGQVFAVCVIYRINENGEMEIMLQREGEKWKLPGGTKEPTDRSLEQTMRREFLEEIGFSPESELKKEADFSYISERNKIFPRGFVRVYSLKVDDISPDMSLAESPDEISWFKFGHAIHILHTSEYKDPLNEVLGDIYTRNRK